MYRSFFKIIKLRDLRLIVKYLCYKYIVYFRLYKTYKIK